MEERSRCPGGHRLRHADGSAGEKNGWKCGGGGSGAGGISAAGGISLTGGSLDGAAVTGDGERMAVRLGCWKPDPSTPPIPVVTAGRWRCDLCDFDRCSFCFLNSEGVAENALNAGGRLATLAANGKYYCGDERFHCGCCQRGRCGPDRGCNCLGCLALDAQMPRLNRDGSFAVRRIEDGRYFCKRRTGNEVCDGGGDGSGGDNDNVCDACRELYRRQPRTNRDGNEAVLDDDGGYSCERCKTSASGHRCHACEKLDADILEATSHALFQRDTGPKEKR